jgi:hypothetical protein
MGCPCSKPPSREEERVRINIPSPRPLQPPSLHSHVPALHAHMPPSYAKPRSAMADHPVMLMPSSTNTQDARAVRVHPLVQDRPRGHYTMTVHGLEPTTYR